MKFPTKEQMEELVIIRPDGKIKRNTSLKVREKEVGLRFSKEGVYFEFRNDGCLNRVSRKKRVLAFLTKYQVHTISSLFEIYYIYHL